MPTGSHIARHLPQLRRYARALSGDQAAGDALVQTLLEEAVADPALRAALAGGRVALYQAFSAVWSRQAAAGAHPGNAPAQAALAPVTPLSRQALLLVVLEEFAPADAARILGVSPDAVSALVRQALDEIEQGAATRALIIEDEPLIAMQLEEIVRAAGHAVCAHATTRAQAREVMAHCRPGVVLADIQLADGSSGLDAVDDILAMADVPVVFVTAYPERLLTGDRAEPTWLVTKPFTEAMVRAMLAQALFFRSPAPAG